MEPITNKKEWVRRNALGIWGNSIPRFTMDTMRSIPDGMGVTIRTTRGGGGFCEYVRYHETWLQTQTIIERACYKAKPLGYRRDEIYMTELMPEQEIILQGEFHELYGCFYSTEKVHMRELKKFEHWYPTRLPLQLNMCPHSYENFQQLVNDYPNHTIEFSVYGVPVGTAKWNSMVWEVRQY